MHGDASGYGWVFDLFCRRRGRTGLCKSDEWEMERDIGIQLAVNVKGTGI